MSMRSKTRERRLSPLEEVPRHLEDTLVHVSVGQITEKSRAHIETSVGTPGAHIGDGGDGGLASGWVGDLQTLTTVRTVVCLILSLVEGDDEVRVGVRPSTGTETDGEVGGLAGVGDSLLERSRGGVDEASDGENRGDGEEGLDGNHFVVFESSDGKDVPGE
jgi:hypothetical protein